MAGSAPDGYQMIYGVRVVLAEGEHGSEQARVDELIADHVEMLDRRRTQDQHDHHQTTGHRGRPG